MPLADGVTLIVIVFVTNPAVTPPGKPVGEPMPVARVVVWVILVIRVLMQSVGDEEAEPTVISGVTIIVPVALTVPQPPESGML